MDWLLWLIGRKEMTELHRWRVQWEEHRRWMAEFPEVSATLDHMKHSVDDVPVNHISVLRDSCRRKSPEARNDR